LGSSQGEWTWQMWPWWCGVGNFGNAKLTTMDLTIGQCEFCHLAKWT
jgi:hypothetical protein